MTVNNKATGTIRANNANGSAIFGDTINIIDNSGVIEAKGMSGVAIDADVRATVANGGGVISGALRGIQANIANVTNAGEITATADSGIAISAASTANVDNSGIIQAMGTGGVAIVGLASTTTVHNLSGGTIKGGQFGIFTNLGGDARRHQWRRRDDQRRNQSVSKAPARCATPARSRARTDRYTLPEAAPIH